MTSRTRSSTCAVYEATVGIRLIDLNAYIKWALIHTESLIAFYSVLSSEGGVIQRARIKPTRSPSVYFVHLFDLINSLLLFAGKIIWSRISFFSGNFSWKSGHLIRLVGLIHWIGILFWLIRLKVSFATEHAQDAANYLLLRINRFDLAGAFVACYTSRRYSERECKRNLGQNCSRDDKRVAKRDYE